HAVGRGFEPRRSRQSSKALLPMKAATLWPERAVSSKIFNKESGKNAFLFLSNLALTRALQAGPASLYCTRDIGPATRVVELPQGFAAARLSAPGMQVGDERFPSRISSYSPVHRGCRGCGHGPSRDAFGAGAFQA